MIGLSVGGASDGVMFAKKHTGKEVAEAAILVKKRLNRSVSE